jgi:tetratricopeptide (TPR) repeat protein
VKFMTILAISTGLFVAEGALPVGMRAVEGLLQARFATPAEAATNVPAPILPVPKADRLPVREDRVAAPMLMAQAPPPPAAEPVAAVEAAAPAAVVDETALRYFARQGDARRLEAEIARLRALYPAWTPPTNPQEVPQAGDPQLDAMWKLYSEERYAEVRKAIADRQTAEPAWQVPPDLLARLAVAEARTRLVNASNLQQYDTVIRVAADTPSLLTCSEVDVLWRLARAFVETKRPDRALDAYRYILTSCDNSGERLATMQMAVAQLKRPALGTLLALERTAADGVGEFASVRSDVARQALAVAGDDAAVKVEPDDLAVVQKLAGEGGKPGDQLLLGWYFIKRNDAVAAESWFRKAHAGEATAEASQGLALALVALKRPAEAEAAMRPFANASDDARAVYLAAGTNLLAVQPQVLLAPEILQQIVAEAAVAKSAAAGQLLGWYSYNLNQFGTAGQWFATALEWKPDDEMSAYGLGLTRLRLGNAAGLMQLQAAWAGRSPRIAMLGREVAPVPGQQAMQPVQPQMMQAQPVQQQMPVQQIMPAQSQAMAPQMLAPQTAQAAQPMQQMQTVPVQPMQVPVQQMPAQPMAAPVMMAPAPLAYAPVAAPAVQPQAVQPLPVRYGEPAPLRRDRRVSTSARPSTGGCRTPVSPATLAPRAALDRGWCLMQLNRPLEAAPAFEVALQTGTADLQRDAAYGQSLAYLRVGLNDKAAVSAARSPQTRQRRVELGTALLTAQATTAFEAKRPVEALMALDQLAQLAPERLDLMILRGYAYLDTGRYGDAQRVFQAVAATGSSAGQKGLNDLRLATGQLKSSD